MILKDAIDLSKSIQKYRRSMYELVEHKGLSDPLVIKISQRLDQDIVSWQKMMKGLTPQDQQFCIDMANTAQYN